MSQEIDRDESLPDTVPVSPNLSFTDDDSIDDKKTFVPLRRQNAMIWGRANTAPVGKHLDSRQSLRKSR